MHKHKLPLTFAVNLIKHLPRDAGKPLSFAIHGNETIIITDAHKCFIYRNGDTVIHQRVLWQIHDVYDTAHLT